MIHVLANRPHGQMIFRTCKQAAEHFKCVPSKLREKINNGLPLRDKNGEWWLDVLLDEDAK